MPSHPPTMDFVSDDGLPVRIVRSVKRRKTISARWDEERLLVQVPAALDERSERLLVQDMVAKYRRRQVRQHDSRSDQALERRAVALDREYFAGRAQPATVRWVDNQRTRWGSVSLHSRKIRLSSALTHAPQWVQDYVLVHELAHLMAPRDGHGPRFQELLNRFVRRAEADAYLSGFSTGFRARAREDGQDDSAAPGFDDDADE